jgi:hypothetical protein
MITALILSLALALTPPMQQAHIATTATRVPVVVQQTDPVRDSLANELWYTWKSKDSLDAVINTLKKERSEIKREHDSLQRSIETDYNSPLYRAWSSFGRPDTMYKGLYFKGDSLKSMYDATPRDDWFKTDTIRMGE